jgi:hypothetical protein
MPPRITPKIDPRPPESAAPPRMTAANDQSPRLEAREATHALAEAARGRTVDRAALAIGMQVIFRENIPPR